MVGRDTLDVTKMSFQLCGLSIRKPVLDKAAPGTLDRTSTLPALPLLNPSSFACLPWRAPGVTTSLPSEPATGS